MDVGYPLTGMPRYLNDSDRGHTHTTGKGSLSFVDSTGDCRGTFPIVIEPSIRQPGACTYVLPKTDCLARIEHLPAANWE